jgi:hypothetical protein
MKLEFNGKTINTIGYCIGAVLTLTILKLCNIINIPWIYVFSPWWIPIIIVIVLFVITVVFACFWTLIDIIKNFIK